jgi:anti-sigma B factor antagonist
MSTVPQDPELEVKVVEMKQRSVQGGCTLIRCSWADEDVGIARAEGPVEGSATRRLDRALAGLIEAGAQTVVVDLTQCQTLDSVTLGVLVRAHRKLSPGGLVVVVTAPEILRLFEITRLDRSIEVRRAASEVTLSHRPG